MARAWSEEAGTARDIHRLGRCLPTTRSRDAILVTGGAGVHESAHARCGNMRAIFEIIYFITAGPCLLAADSSMPGRIFSPSTAETFVHRLARKSNVMFGIRGAQSTQ